MNYSYELGNHRNQTGRNQTRNSWDVNCEGLTVAATSLRLAWIPPVTTWAQVCGSCLWKYASMVSWLMQQLPRILQDYHVFLPFSRGTSRRLLGMNMNKYDSNILKPIQKMCAKDVW